MWWWWDSANAVMCNVICWIYRYAMRSRASEKKRITVLAHLSIKLCALLSVSCLFIQYFNIWLALAARVHVIKTCVSNTRVRVCLVFLLWCVCCVREKKTQPHRITNMNQSNTWNKIRPDENKGITITRFGGDFGRVVLPQTSRRAQRTLRESAGDRIDHFHPYRVPDITQKPALELRRSPRLRA